MKKLSVETLEAFVKANGKNHKPITEIDEKIGADYTRHILKIADKAYKNPIRETLKCVFGSFKKVICWVIIFHHIAFYACIFNKR